ncbi:hypothetical protein HYALB_00010547 [Hymenoscyphus albidus]|uniref:Uncharacterized protein n=1 Tax=Hymenoscyphus albidus TaxID=595503 RepID=A0A9N9LH26_9HELO|nr:hypothetical protein HYALB_00010547 [Hymenoscyphus albidus]
MEKSRSPSQGQRGAPISPPKTRSASADNSVAALVEDWRAYTQKIRSQFDGEKAHMIADRARADEVMAEERQLYEQEIAILKARIKQLETAAAENSTENITHQSREQQSSSKSPTSTSPSTKAPPVGSGESSSRGIPQESGRNADGTPFYAPAPRNPSRSFSTTSEERIDSMISSSEDVIRVAHKELRSSDFGVQSPLHGHEPNTRPESHYESIDISYIQPELEGVSIKASAVNPVLVAKILSPGRSPATVSPNLNPPRQEKAGESPPHRKSLSSEEKAKMTLQIAGQPENMRLKMHAGHTPSHSISKFEDLAGVREVSEAATPTQGQHSEAHRLASTTFGDDGAGDPEEDNGDRELTGPLTLTNGTAADDYFLAQLDSKLEAASKSGNVSPSESGVSLSSTTRSREISHDEEYLAEKDDGPRLRIKPSLNFGAPMGRL